MNKIFSSLILISAIFPVVIQAQGSVPDLINFQGILSDESGQPLSSGNYTVSFSFYDAETNGNLVWGPQIFDGTVGTGHGAQLAVVDGYFNVILGPEDTTGRSILDAFDEANRYLEIVVNGTLTISPRQRILSTPYAIQSATSANSSQSPISVLQAFYLNLDNAIQTGIQPDYQALSVGAEVFTDADGYRNLIDTTASTATYSEDEKAWLNANGAGTPVSNAASNATVSTFWTPVKIISVSNGYVTSVTNEIKDDTGSQVASCRMRFIYEDFFFEYSEESSTSASTYESQTYSNPNPLKKVNQVEVQLMTSNAASQAHEQNDTVNTMLYNGTKTVVTKTLLNLTETPLTLSFFSKKRFTGPGSIILTEISDNGGTSFTITGLSALDGESVDISSMIGTELALKFEISGDDLVYFEGFSFEGPQNSSGSNPEQTGLTLTPEHFYEAIGMNIIRQLQNRVIDFSADGKGGFGEAFVDADGRMNSVDIPNTTAYYTSGIYSALSNAEPLVFIEASGLTEANFAIRDCEIITLGSGKWILHCTSGTFQEKRAKIIATLFYDRKILDIVGLTSIKTNISKDIGRQAHFVDAISPGPRFTGLFTGTFSNTVSNYAVSSWCLLSATDYTGDYSEWELPIGTVHHHVDRNQYSNQIGSDTEADERNNPINCTLDMDVGSGGGGVLLVLCSSGISWSDGIGGGNPETISFKSQHSIPDFINGTTEPHDSIITLNIPTGAYSDAISTSFGIALVSGWESEAEIFYKLTNGIDDTGFLNVSEIVEFTAFSSEPTHIIIKLVPKAGTINPNIPGIRGFWVKAK